MQKTSEQCKHKNFIQMYTITNISKNVWWKGGIDFICKDCETSCNVSWQSEDFEWKKRSLLQKYTGCFLWMLPGVLLIWGLGYYYVSLYYANLWTDLSTWLVFGPMIGAIIAISLFHFWAMYYCIYSERLIITKTDNW